MAEKPAESEKSLQRAAPSQALSPFDDMERWMESQFPRGWLRPFRWGWPELAPGLETRLPRVDVIDRDEEVVVRAEIPGVEKKDLDLSLTDNTLTIKGSTERATKEEKGAYYRSEITRGSFSRTVALPAEIDGARAKATFKDGILELVAPKVQASKRHAVKVE